MKTAGQQALADGFEDPFSDPRFLRCMIAAFESLAAIWAAEDGGEAARAWMPYDDPLAALRHDIERARNEIADLEKAARDAERRKRDGRLEGVRKRYTSTTDLAPAEAGGRHRIDPNSPEYLDIILAHVEPAERDRLEVALLRMKEEETTARRRDVLGRAWLEFPAGRDAA